VKLLHKAKYYQKIDQKKVQCNLCSHRCVIEDQSRGICAVRENQKGTLYSLVYGKLISKAVDPIEKKPLYHFLPSSFAYSIATMGCNFRCSNCQNWQISQISKTQNKVIGQEFSPEEIVDEAKQSGSKSIAYTYSEPTIFLEYASDIAKIAVKKGLKNVLVTNGYITKEALEDVADYFHAANIDLKSFSDDFYKKNCGAKLNPVLESIKLYYKLGIWIEITTLIIPKLNDSEKNLRQIANFIKDIDPQIPWHISRFYPMYKLDNQLPTPTETLRKAKK
jgi:pyruvate formate lyase activating enzyme